MRTLVIQANTGRDAVVSVCHAVLEHGRPVAPRGKQTLELSPVHIELRDPSDVIPDGIGRAKLLPAIGAAEALQNLAGAGAPGLMSRISSFFPKPTNRWGGDVVAYGERIGRQLHDALELLRVDPSTREAVVSIWRHDDMRAGQAHNLCTTTLQFLRRDGGLDLLVNMRSNDAWYGLCYDLFQFTQVQLTMANALGIPAGRYFHSAASMHLYERHWDVAAALHLPDRAHVPTRLWGLGVEPLAGWYRARLRAEALLAGRLPEYPTATEEWYAATLAPYEPNGG